jgi:hypothetical protein
MRWLRATGGHERWGRRRLRLSGMTGWNGGFSVWKVCGLFFGGSSVCSRMGCGGVEGLGCSLNLNRMRHYRQL